MCWKSLVLAVSLVLVAADPGIRRPAVRMPEMRIRMLMHRRLGHRDEVGHKVCFDLLGCFNEGQPLALKRPPQHPSVIQTRFLLYTRDNKQEPQLLEYGDELRSMNRSRLEASRKLKIVIHGFKGSGLASEGMVGVQAFLDLEDVNVVVVDWAKGAGATYGVAVSNVEVVGRQLGLILMDAIHMGMDPDNIHIVGFSLGAHVAGCAAEMLKKHGHVVGRITGLDPASPFFRHHLFREKSRKLDASDARLVDVIHSDGSADFADGFGLLKPIGHIDFFPNGGRQQPGCNDVKNSVVVSHLNEDSLDINIACSHARSWFLFVESLQTQKRACKFQSWPCKRRFGSYTAGSCFPPEETTLAPEMGYAADRGPGGLFYLATRAEYPYCGVPLRVGARVSDTEFRPRGMLFVKVEIGGSVTTFSVLCDQGSLPPLSSLNNRNNAQPVFYDIKAADYETYSTNVTTIVTSVRFEPIVSEDTQETEYANTLLIDKITLEDRKGNRWESCGRHVPIGLKEEVLLLKDQKC